MFRPRARRDTGDIEDIFATNTEGQDLVGPYGPTNYVPGARESANDSWAEEESNLSMKNDVDSSFDKGGTTPTTVSRLACARRKASSLQTFPGFEEPRQPCKADSELEVACTGYDVSTFLDWIRR
jgi:hypothetical protein